jgi:hypothetical protein
VAQYLHAGTSAQTSAESVPAPSPPASAPPGSSCPTWATPLAMRPPARTPPLVSEGVDVGDRSPQAVSNGRQIQPDSTAVTQRAETGPFKAADTALTLGQRDLHLRSLWPSSRDRRRRLASAGHSRSSPRTSMNTKAGELDGAAAEQPPTPPTLVGEFTSSSRRTILQYYG